MELNKCRLVKDTCNWVHKQSQNVKIIQQKIKDIQQIKYTAFDGFECHKIELDDEQQLIFLFALDAMNFCFWQNEIVQYDFLAKSVRDAVLQKSLTISTMTQITSKTLETVIFKNQMIPLVQERSRILNEVSSIVIQKFSGLFTNVIKSAQKSAVKLLNILTSNFPNFQDHAIYKGHQIHFYKRSQILIGDIYAHFKGKGLGQFTDIKQLTMFADYRVPQILRELGVLQYSQTLTKIIDSKQQIPHGGRYEIQIRAATVVAVEMIREWVKINKQQEVLSIQVDWFLWQLGEKNLKTLKPHHRVLSIYY